MAGVEDREVPLFARQSLQSWFAGRAGSGSGARGTVLLWPETFTNFFQPHVGQAAVELLEHAGWRVAMPREPLCCGLTWISTGQLGVAGHLHDAGELFPGDRDVRRLAEQTVTLA